eukprot:jgi/Botrbrau1/9302/Bobra.0111s0026.1
MPEEGWNLDLKLALLEGCIPIIVSDTVQMDFGDVLPLHDFCFIVPPHYLYSLRDMLATMVKDFSHKVREYRERGPCARRYLSWNKETGRAGEALVCALRRRLLGLHHWRPFMDWAACTLNCTVTHEDLVEVFEKQAGLLPRTRRMLF